MEIKNRQQDFVSELLVFCANPVKHWNNFELFEELKILEKMTESIIFKLSWKLKKSETAATYGFIHCPVPVFDVLHQFIRHLKCLTHSPLWIYLNVCKSDPGQDNCFPLHNINKTRQNLSKLYYKTTTESEEKNKYSFMKNNDNNSKVQGFPEQFSDHTWIVRCDI